MLTLAVVRHPLGRPSERAFLAEVGLHWGAYVPEPPRQSERNCRGAAAGLGAFELLRQAAPRAAPEDGWDHAADVAVELDIGQVMLGSLDLGRVLLGLVAQRLHLRLAVERVESKLILVSSTRSVPSAVSTSGLISSIEQSSAVNAS